MCIRDSTDGVPTKFNYYSPIELSNNMEDLKLWHSYRSEDIESVKGEIVKVTFWILDKYLCQKVKRDPTWYETNIAKINKFWKDVTQTRESGWREAVKVTEQPSCLLDFQTGSDTCIGSAISTICFLDPPADPLTRPDPCIGSTVCLLDYPCVDTSETVCPLEDPCMDSNGTVCLLDDTCVTGTVCLLD